MKRQQFFNFRGNLQLFALTGALIGAFFFGQRVQAAGIIEIPPGDVTWTKAQSPIIYDGLPISGTLTIEPGVVVKLLPHVILSAETIHAVGTSTDPIIFTSYKDDSVGGDSNEDGTATTPARADWNRISSSTSADMFSFVEIRYADIGLRIPDFGTQTISHLNVHDNNIGVQGGVNWHGEIINSIFTNNEGGIYFPLSGSDVVIKNNLVHDNKDGINLNNVSNFTVTNNEVRDNTNLGVYFNGSSLTTNHVNQNNIIGNFRGIYNDSNLLVDGTNNWWGNASGPYNEFVNPTGTGDFVSTHVSITPWLGQEVSGQQKIPVIIIPGILGTEISKGDDLLWADIERMISTHDDKFMDPLAFNFDGEPVDNSLEIKNVIDKKIFLGKTVLDYTNGLINELIKQGYTKDKDLFLFSYDWRADLNSVAQSQLKTFIDEKLSDTGSRRIDVIAHSQGGLIMKRLLSDNPLYAGKINQLIFVGTPNLGAPKAAKALLYGDSMGVEFLGLGLDPSEVKSIAHNMPSIYELLPSAEYFNHNEGYLGTTKQLLGLVTGYSIINNYKDTNQNLIDKGLNSTLLEASNQFHDSDYDNFDFGGKGMLVSNIVGCQEGTISQILEEKNGKFALFYGAGDGTVPVISANNIPGANTYFAKKSSHSELLTEDGTRQLITNLITGSTLDTKGLVTQNSSDCSFDGRTVSVHSPVSLNIYDEYGEHVGPNETGGLDLDIPGAQYDIIGEDKFAYLPSGHSYNIKLFATGSGTFDFYSSTIENGEITDTAFYNDVAIGNSSAALTTLTQQNDQQLQLDFDGDGVGDSIIDQSANGADLLSDLTNPISTATLDGNQGQAGSFRSDVSFAISALDPADDSGFASGILNTYYQIDNSAYEIYSAPVLIGSEGVHTLKYYSVDKAGNNEEIQTQIVTIDKTYPELGISFDFINNNFAFSPTDNLDSNPVLNCSEINCIINDNAGNTTTIQFKKDIKKPSSQIVINSVTYGNQPIIQFIDNNLKVSYSDKSSKQSFNLKGLERSSVIYDISDDQSQITNIISGKRATTTQDGLAILHINTKQGMLNVSIK